MATSSRLKPSPDFLSDSLFLSFAPLLLFAVVVDMNRVLLSFITHARVSLSLSLLMYT